MSRRFFKARGVIWLVPVTLASLVGGLPGHPAGAGAPAAGWPGVDGPSKGPARVIGTYTGACIAGAVPLRLQGTGYQAVAVSRRRFFGHPSLNAYIVELGQQVAAQRLGTMLVGDMAQPRGGPMSSGHVSHQGGLDVDIWFRLDVPPVPVARRERIAQPSVVDPATGRPDPERWTDRHAELIRLAASHPQVSRIFVGAAIKRDLCERTWDDRTWLRLVRPWPGHDEHLHVRLHCPPDSPTCIDQAPLPPRDGCGADELVIAFARERAASRRPPPVPARVLPPACDALLSSAD